MSADTKAGYRSVTITIPQPMEDDGITPRTDLVGLKVWGGSYSGFPVSDAYLLFYGRGLSCTIEKLAPGVPAFFRWALVSEIEPDNYIVSDELSVTPLETPNSISIADGSIHGIGGGGDGSFVDNKFIDPGIVWSSSDPSVLAVGRTIKSLSTIPQGGVTVGALAKVGQCFSFNARHVSGLWSATVQFAAILPAPSITIGIDSTGFFARTNSSATFRPTDSVWLLENSGGFFRIESYIDRYCVYSSAAHQPLVVFSRNLIDSGDSEGDFSGQAIFVSIFSSDARVDGIDISSQRDKVYYGSVQPGAIQNSAIKTTSLENGKFLKAGSLENSAEFLDVLFSDIHSVPYPVSGGWFDSIPKIAHDGVMDIGRYIDFHSTNGESSDYTIRLDASPSGILTNTGVFRSSAGSISSTGYGFAASGSTGIYYASPAGIGFSAGGVASVLMDSAGTYPGGDNNKTLGKVASRWSTVYAGTGTINTSDAREKTPVRALSPAELAAAKELAREIGAYQFLAAVTDKGVDKARHHAGLTVQRAIGVMESHGLDPMRYGFICFDAWAEEVIEHPAECQKVFIPQHMDDFGNLLEARYEQGPVIKDAWTETRPAGDRFSFRMDELLAFIARGLDARLEKIESLLGVNGYM